MDLFFLFSAVITNSILGLIVFSRNFKSRVNQWFLLIVFNIVLWSITNFYADHAVSLAYNLAFTRLAFTFAIWIAMSIFAFSYYFPYKKQVSRIKRIIFLSLFPVLGIFSYSQLVTQSVKKIKNGTAVDLTIGSLYYLYILIFIAFIVMAIVSFIKSYKLSNATQRNQIRFISLGIVISTFLGVMTQLVLPLIFNSWNTSRFGPFLSVTFVLFLSIAIIRQKLFDIRAVVARSATYILSVLIIATVYGFTAFWLTTSFTKNLSQNTQYAIYTVLAVILAFTFYPLRRFFERVTDKIFYRDKYDPQTVLNNVSHTLTSHIEIDKLSSTIIKTLTTQLRLKSANIIVVDGEKIFFQSQIISGPKRNLGLKDLKKLSAAVVVADDLSGGERKVIMSDYGISVSLTLRTREQFVGYLLLGEKLSGDIYNDTDLRVLRIVANELAVAITNAKSYAEIQRFNETLQAKIAQATKKLHVANDNLKELDKAKDEFISMASHQLRTPLTTAKGYVSMVLEGDFGRITKSQQEPLQQALDSSNRMAGLVSDLLNVSRMDAGKFFIDAHDSDLASLVQSEVDGLKSMAESKHVKLSYHPPAKALPLMNLDEEKTRQVVMNLIDNAIHYSSPAKDGGDVRVSLKRDGSDVVFEVVDNGIGVPEKMKEKLFTKFYRAANAQASRPDGTGLGLYLVRRVVEDQGGVVIFESTEGVGSTFGFRFPLKTKFKSGVTKARVPLS